MSSKPVSKKKNRKREGKRGRKVGRDKEDCLHYRATHRREKNKIRRIEKHLKKHPNDLQAYKAISQLSQLL